MRYVALIVALLTLSVGIAPAVAVTAAGDVTDQPTPGTAASPGVVGGTVLQADGTTDNETPRTTIAIDLRGNTSARWTITTRQPLDDETEREAFRELIAAFEAGEAGTRSDVQTFRNYAAQAENYTDREMEIRRVDTTGRIDESNTIGILNLSFTWTNFGDRTENGRLRVKDAFLRADGESWFPRLTDEQRLVIHGPPEYRTYATPSAARQQGNTVIFDSGQELDPETVYATFQPEPQQPAGFLDDLLGSPDALLMVGALLVVAVVGVIAAARYRREDSPPSASASESAPDSSADRPDPAEAAAGTAATESDEATADASDDAVDLELLSDEERVEHLLEQNGGRMKQASIVEETGWSDAKVSQLLSAMAEEDRINKLRLGRENLISLPDEDDPV